VLKALNVTSGRHVVAESASAAPAVAETAPGLVSPPAAQPDCAVPASTSPQPAGERLANGHASVAGTAPCQDGGEHAGSVLQHSAPGDEDDGAAMGAATKRLKLDAGIAGGALHPHRACSTHERRCCRYTSSATVFISPPTDERFLCRRQCHEWRHHPGRARWRAARQAQRSERRCSARPASCEGFRHPSRLGMPLVPCHHLSKRVAGALRGTDECRCSRRFAAT